MANMTVHERNQLGRYDLADRQTRLNRATAGQERAFSVLSATFVVVLGVLIYAATRVFDGWPHAIVLADMAVVFFGVAAWIYPDRKHA
jgi:hypothetical protein